MQDIHCSRSSYVISMSRFLIEDFIINLQVNLQNWPWCLSFYYIHYHLYTYLLVATLNGPQLTWSFVAFDLSWLIFVDGCFVIGDSNYVFKRLSTSKLIILHNSVLYSIFYCHSSDYICPHWVQFQALFHSFE